MYGKVKSMVLGACSCIVLGLLCCAFVSFSRIKIQILKVINGIKVYIRMKTEISFFIFNLAIS